MLEYTRKLKVLEQWIFWLVLWVGTALILWASKDYFIPPRVHAFLIERPHLTEQNGWRYTLYVHVVSGCLCLVSSLLQYSGILLRKFPSLHKSLGYIYVISLLLAVIPSGMILSAVAKGGLMSQLGFFMMNFCTLICVLLGLNAILKGKVRSHQAWITRSFALVTSAITFRAVYFFSIKDFSFF